MYLFFWTTHDAFSDKKSSEGFYSKIVSLLREAESQVGDARAALGATLTASNAFSSQQKVRQKVLGFFSIEKVNIASPNFWYIILMHII